MAKKGKLSRRSFMMRVAGGVAATGAIASVAGAAVYRGRSDADPRDPAGNGRTGITDSDPNDSVGRGTGYTGLSDSDGGACADAGGHGRGNTGFTDSDSSGCVDPAGRGRG